MPPDMKTRLDVAPCLGSYGCTPEHRHQQSHGAGRPKKGLYVHTAARPGPNCIRPEPFPARAALERVTIAGLRPSLASHCPVQMRSMQLMSVTQFPEHPCALMTQIAPTGKHASRTTESTSETVAFSPPARSAASTSVEFPAVPRRLWACTPM